MGSRLDDVVWDPTEACKLAVADSGPIITLLDFGKVRGQQYKPLSIIYSELGMEEDQFKDLIHCMPFSLPFSQSPSTYQKLTVPKRPGCRLSCVRYLPPTGQYTLASSDRQAVHLWDTRRGSGSAAELLGTDSLISSAEVLSGGRLVCAVTSQQQVRSGGVPTIQRALYKT